MPVGSMAPKQDFTEEQEAKVLQLPREPTAAAQSSERVAALAALAAAVRDADISKEFIMLPTEQLRLLPPSLRKSIYVRQCYQNLMDRLANAPSMGGSVATGTPGIGKSSFVIYLLCYLARQRCKFVYVVGASILGRLLVTMDFKDPEHPVVDMQSHSDELMCRSVIGDRERTWVVLDGKAQPYPHHHLLVRVVVLAELNRKNWHQFRKGSLVEMLYMNVWDLDELQACRRRLYADVAPAVTTERYRQYGGVVRSVLAQGDRSFSELVQQASFSGAAKLRNLEMLDLHSEEIAHTLAHIRATKDFKMKSYMLGSPEIAKVVFQLGMQDHQNSVVNLLNAAPGLSAVAGLTGLMFGQQGHVMLPAGVTVRMRQLLQGKRPLDINTEQRNMRPRADGAAAGSACRSSSGALSTGSEGEAGLRCDAPHTARAGGACTAAAGPQPRINARGDLRDVSVVSDCVTLDKVQHMWDVPGVDLTATDEFYLQPISTRNASWDALYSSKGKRYILQYMVDRKQHGVKAKGIVNLLQKLGPMDSGSASAPEVKLVFVVPSTSPHLYEKFSWQPWQAKKGTVMVQPPAEVAGMQQWVMELKL